MIPFDQRLAAFVQLGRVFDLFGWRKPWPGPSCGLSEAGYAAFERAIGEAGVRNPWFTEENVRNMLRSLSIMLGEEDLAFEANHEHALQDRQPRRPANVGIIMAGNVPMVGSHDLLCVVLSGHRAQVKLSTQDDVLIPATIDLLEHFAPGFRDHVRIIEGRLGEVDAVIATGSTNTARHFEHYFGHLPRIIRKGRIGVAIVDDDEDDEGLEFYAEDVFRYFGLGCRSVSKIFFPRHFEMERFLKATERWNQDIILHPKWASNLMYNRALWLLDDVRFLANGFILLKEDTSLASPVATIHYERYDDRTAVLADLEKQRDRVQCIVGRGPGMVPPGNAQFPKVWDYADGVDTMAFLAGLSQGQNS